MQLCGTTNYLDLVTLATKLEQKTCWYAFNTLKYLFPHYHYHCGLVSEYIAGCSGLIFHTKAVKEDELKYMAERVFYF